MSPQPPPDRAVQLYEALVATHPSIERKGKTRPYTSVNGNMFTVLSEDGTLGMRLAGADRDVFLHDDPVGLVKACAEGGDERVAVPAELLARTSELAPYLAKSYNYAKSLKPKPTTRRR